MERVRPGPFEDGGRMIDISVSLREGMAHYPGDPPFRRRLVAEIGGNGGGGCRVSELLLSAHAGTHVDAPAHFLPNGATLDDLPVGFFSGPARVVAYTGIVLDREAIAAIAPPAGELVLYHTRDPSLRDKGDFCRGYTALDLGGAEALVAAGVRGVGIDYLSVEGPGTGGEVHRLLLGAGLAVIEGLDLSKVRPGRYVLVCLPLRIAGAEGAPVRAVLLRG